MATVKTFIGNVKGNPGKDGKDGSENQIYSTNETVIGKWIDGKPLYRKVVQGKITSSTQSLFVVNENVETMVYLYGYDIAGNYNWSFNYAQGTSTYKSIFYNKGTDTVEFRSNTNSSGETFTVIMEYTKTTD